MTTARRPSRRLSRATAVVAAAVVAAGAGAASAAAAPRSVDLGERPVVIATVGSPGDSATAAGAAARVGAPVLYTTSTSLSPSTRDFLRGYKASSVVLVGGTAAISQGVAKEVDAVSGTLHRVQGRDKYETAAAVAAFMARVPAAAAAEDGASAYDLWLAAGNKGTTATFLASLRGPQGLQGLQGAAGAAGKQGPAGEDGAQGEKGLPGQDGAQGEKGLPGQDGAQGPRGDIGPAGPQGAPGEPGVQGPVGTKGDKGDVGATGPAGASVASGYHVVERVVPVTNDQYMIASVSCGAGELALSGGFSVDEAFGDARTGETSVQPDGRTYQFRGVVSGSYRAMTLRVVCVAGTSGVVG